MPELIEKYKQEKFVHSNARLLWEWEAIDKRLKNNKEISYSIVERNAEGLPVEYEVYYDIRSFCGVADKDKNGLERPLFADEFKMKIFIPNNYPSIDSKLVFRFLTEDVFGIEIPHPWHPNIRYFGDFAGHVCLNNVAYGTYTDIALYIEKIALYLKYDKYHALNIPPFPEDNIVAEWVVNQAEPNGWIDELKNNKMTK